MVKIIMVCDACPEYNRCFEPCPLRLAEDEEIKEFMEKERLK